MILDRITKDEGALHEIQQLTFKLAQMGLYGALYEAAAMRAALLTWPGNGDATERAALSHAWHLGFIEAIEDMFNFAKRARVASTLPPADFNAPETLRDSGELTEDEYNQLRRSSDGSR